MALIQLTDVKKSFNVKKQTIQAVDGVSLTVDKGDIYGIVGYSGAGKSTLVRLLNGLELATDGSVVVDGQDIGKLKSKELREFRKNVGMIFQHFNLLWSRTVLENIELPMELAGIKKEKRQQKAKELLALVNLEGRGDAYPAQLSGGQKQRAAIARAFIGNPQVILADEPTASLDPDRGQEIAQLIQKEVKSKNKSAIMVTHDRSILTYVDTIYELKHSQLLKVEKVD